MPEYNRSNIRTLLMQGFSGEELRRFSFDTPAFRELYEDLPRTAGKSEIVDTLLDYAIRRSLLDALLQWAARKNSARYEQYKPYTSLGDASVTASDGSAVAQGDSAQAASGGSAAVKGNVHGNIHIGDSSSVSTVSTQGGPTNSVIWAIVIVAVIALCSITVVVLPGSLPDIFSVTDTTMPIPAFTSTPTATLTPTPTSAPQDMFSYQVRVTDATTNNPVARAQVSIDVPSLAPLRTDADSEGVAILDIPANYAGERGFVRIQATGFEPYELNINIFPNVLPSVISLSQLTPQSDKTGCLAFDINDIDNSDNSGNYNVEVEITRQ